jgi:hypothetical protein
MSAVTEGKWQLREEAWADDGREVEVVSWEMLEAEYTYHLDMARDDYVRALGCLRAGNRTGFRSWVQTGLQHKLAAHALFELTSERYETQRHRGLWPWRLPRAPEPSLWGTYQIAGYAPGGW